MVILIYTCFRSEQRTETGNDVFLFTLNFNTAIVRNILEVKTHTGHCDTQTEKLEDNETHSQARQ